MNTLYNIGCLSKKLPNIVDIIKREGYFNKPINKNISDFQYRLYEQVLKPDAEGAIDADIYSQCMQCLTYDGEILKIIFNQTSDLCKAALYNYPLALEYVKDQTEELCFTAVSRNSAAEKFIRDQSVKEKISQSLSYCQYKKQLT